MNTRTRANLYLDEYVSDAMKTLPQNVSASNVTRVLVVALTKNQKDFDQYIKSNPELKVVVEYIAKNALKVIGR
jgi:hypothetical protein